LLAAVLLAACGGSSDVELGAIAPEGNAGQSGAAGAGSGGAPSAGGAGAPAAGSAGSLTGGAAGKGGAGLAGQSQGGAGQSQGGAGGAVTLTACKVPVDFKSGDETACDASGTVSYSWNGTACAVRLDGPFCACSGPDCALMFASFEACMDLNSSCTSTVPCDKLVAAGEPFAVASSPGGTPGGTLNDRTPWLSRINGVLETADPAIDLLTSIPVSINGPTPSFRGISQRSFSPWNAWPPPAVSEAVSVGTEGHDGLLVGQPELQPHGAALFPSLSSGMGLLAPLNSGMEIAIEPGNSAPLFVVEGSGVVLLGYRVSASTAPFSDSLWIDVLKPDGAGGISWQNSILVGCGTYSPTASAVRTSDGFLLAFSGGATAEKCGPQFPESLALSGHVFLAHVTIGALPTDVQVTQLGEAPQGVESTTYKGTVVPSKDVPVRQINLVRRGSGAWLSWTRNPHDDGSPTDWEYVVLDEQGGPVGAPLVWGDGQLFFPTRSAARVGDAIAYAVVLDFKSQGGNSPTLISLQLTRASGTPPTFQTVSAAIAFDDAVSQPLDAVGLIGSPDGRSVLVAWAERQVQQTEPVPDVIKLQRFDCQSAP
jgi:hypothetical protein